MFALLGLVQSEFDDFYQRYDQSNLVNKVVSDLKFKWTKFKTRRKTTPTKRTIRVSYIGIIDFLQLLFGCVCILLIAFLQRWQHAVRWMRIVLWFVRITWRVKLTIVLFQIVYGLDCTRICICFVRSCFTGTVFI